MKTTSIAVIAVIIALMVGGGALVYTTYGSGTLLLKMTDPPSDWGPAEAVYITFNNIMIHRAEAGNESGWVSTGVSASNLSLLDIVDVNKTVGQASLQAGLYNIIRFNVTNAIVTYNGANYSAVVESGKLNVSIVPGGVRVTAGQSTSMLIDITVRVTGSIGSFKLVPAARATLT